MLMVLFESPQRVGFNESDFGQKVQESLNFEEFFFIENSIKFFKSGFGRKDQVGNQFALGPMSLTYFSFYFLFLFVPCFGFLMGSPFFCN